MGPDQGIRNLLLVMIILAALSVASFACGGGDEETEETPAAVPPATATQAPEDTSVAETPGAETSVPEPTDVPALTPANGGPTSEPDPTEAAQPTINPGPAATPVPTEEPYPAAPGIVDPSNTGWPREVETLDGRITLEGPPQRILTYSLGHDEMVMALVPPERIAALGKFASNPEYSNVADIAPDYPVFEKGAENVLAAQPDLFIVSAFTDADIVDLVKDAGVPVVRPALESSAEGNIPNILLLGYMLGVEARALELASEIESRLALIAGRVPAPGDESRPSVISISRYSDSISVSGGGTSGNGIIEAAGGVNAAARAGIDGFQTITNESIAAMNPDFIIIPQAGDAAVALRDDLMNDPVLAAIAAIANEEVHIVDAANHITLSHWNVRGIETTAEILFADLFADVAFTDFEPYRGE